MSKNSLLCCYHFRIIIELGNKKRGKCRRSLALEVGLAQVQHLVTFLHDHHFAAVLAEIVLAKCGGLDGGHLQEFEIVDVDGCMRVYEHLLDASQKQKCDQFKKLVLDCLLCPRTLGKNLVQLSSIDWPVTKLGAKKKTRLNQLNQVI